MVTKDVSSDEDDLQPKYDETSLRGGVRGKYVERYRNGTNVVLLDPDVAAVFPTSEAVNHALRMLVKIAKESTTEILS